MIDISSKELPIAVKFQSVFSGKYKRNLLESVQCWQPAHSTISVWQFSISSATGDWADPGKSCWCELKLQQPLLKTDVSNAKQTKKRGFERMTANVWIWSCSDLSRERKKSCHRSKSKSLPTNVASCDHQSIITIKIHKAGSDKSLILKKKGWTKLI